MQQWPEHDRPTSCFWCIINRPCRQKQHRHISSLKTIFGSPPICPPGPNNSAYLSKNAAAHFDDDELTSVEALNGLDALVWSTDLTWLESWLVTYILSVFTPFDGDRDEDDQPSYKSYLLCVVESQHTHYIIYSFLISHIGYKFTCYFIFLTRSRPPVSDISEWMMNELS